MPADGPDLFATVAHQTGFDEDKWITALEVLPGNKQVLHHLLLWQGEEGGGSNPQSVIGLWAPGTLPSRLQAGTGRLLKKGTALVSDMHYHPVGVAATDVTRIGLHFAKKEIEKELVNHWIINSDFEIQVRFGKFLRYQFTIF